MSDKGHTNWYIRRYVCLIQGNGISSGGAGRLSDLADKKTVNSLTYNFPFDLFFFSICILNQSNALFCPIFIAFAACFVHHSADFLDADILVPLAAHYKANVEDFTLELRQMKRVVKQRQYLTKAAINWSLLQISYRIMMKLVMI